MAPRPPLLLCCALALALTCAVLCAASELRVPRPTATPPRTPGVALPRQAAGYGMGPVWSTRSTGSRGPGTAPAESTNKKKKKKKKVKRRPQGPIGMQYHGGAVLTRPIRVFVVWAGDFTEQQKGLVRSFLGSLRGSSAVAQWWALNTLYYSGPLSATGQPLGGYASADVSLAGEHDVTPPPGGVITGTGVWGLVGRSIEESGAWPVDSDAVYAVISNSSFTQRGLPPHNLGGSSCSSFCGWHANARYQGVNLRYSWTGMLRCASACWQPVFAGGAPPPSADASAHAAVSILAHELAEAATDADGDGWFDRSGNENADKCAWGYGVGPAATWNMAGEGGDRFLVQGNWNLRTGTCGIAP